MENPITHSHAPLVSILTVNYRQPAITMEFVRSIMQISYPNWELIVVNNGENDDALEKELQEYEKVKLINSEANLGFAGGNNLGLKYCSGKYVLFINNDTEVESDFLEPLVSIFQNDNQIGMVSPLIVFDFDRSTIQYAGSTRLNQFTMRNKGIGTGETNKGQYSGNRITDYIHGAAMLVPAQVISEVGKMREEYFLYYEEYDWCYRVSQAGYKIYFCGDSLVFHKESASTGVMSPLKTYYLTRNRLHFAKMNFTKVNMVISFLFFSLVSMPFHLFKFMLSGRFDLAKAMIKGWVWNFYN